jgi:hypothetical protein
MGQLLGILGAGDNTMLSALNPVTVTDAVNQVLARYNAEKQTAFSFFVEGETTDWKTVYALGGGDEMQELGPNGRPIEQRVTGSWEVAYPIRRYAAAIGWDYETFQYLTAADLERQVDSVAISNAKTHRKQIMRAIFGNANYNWTDVQGQHGVLTIRRLANSDGSTYPATATSDTEADDNHYLVSSYATASISDTNNPLVTLRDEIREHFGGTGRIVAVINSAEQAKIQALTQFTDAPTAGVTPGSDTAVADAGIPGVPGRFIGIDGASGVYVYVWDRIPATYIFARDMDQPAPLKRRVHSAPALQGFKLEAEDVNHPLYKRSWWDRFGYAAGNRLNGAVMFLDAGSSYTVPSVYA